MLSGMDHDPVAVQVLDITEIAVAGELLDGLRRHCRGAQGAS